MKCEPNKQKAIGVKAIARTAGLIMATVLMAGCIVTSVYPFYTEKDVIFDSALIGHWTNVEEQKENWTFEKGGTNEYRLTYCSENQTNVVAVHLFKTHGQMFLDLFAGEGNCEVMPPPIPSHLLLRIYHLKPKLRMAALNHDWLASMLQKNPRAVRHERMKIGDKSDDVRIVLTAETAQLQKFILGQLNTQEAWKDPFELRRDN